MEFYLLEDDQANRPKCNRRKKPSRTRGENVMSQDEVVDIVDENDKVLYQVSKKVAHDKGLLHRCVVSEIKDSQGRWF